MDRYADVKAELRPKAGPTVWLSAHRYAIPLTPDEAREYAQKIISTADRADKGEYE